MYKRHCINCNVQLHSMIAVKDINRYELHFRQFMLMANPVTPTLMIQFLANAIFLSTFSVSSFFSPFSSN